MATGNRRPLESERGMKCIGGYRDDIAIVARDNVSERKRTNERTCDVIARETGRMNNG